MTKRKQTAIDDIYNAIIRLEKNESTQQKISDEIGVNRTTVRKLMEKDKKEKIKSAFEENINSQGKRLRTPKYVDLDYSFRVVLTNSGSTSRNRHKWSNQFKKSGTPLFFTATLISSQAVVGLTDGRLGLICNS